MHRDDCLQWKAKLCLGRLICAVKGEYVLKGRLYVGDCKGRYGTLVQIGPTSIYTG